MEIFSKTGQDTKGKDDYAYCHQTLAALSVWGNNVRHWLQYGACCAPSTGWLPPWTRDTGNCSTLLSSVKLVRDDSPLQRL